MARIPSDELVTAQKDLSARAFGLLMYYYSKGPHHQWRDEEISEDLNLSMRKVKEYRRELINMDYLYITKGEVTNVFIGRQAVMEWKAPLAHDSETGEV